MLQKGNAALHLSVNNLYYNKFLATDLHAELLTTRNGLTIKTVGLKTSGGSLRLSGNIQSGSKENKLSLNTVVITMDIPLRNPRGDSAITDKDQVKKKRYKGIVLHLRAKAGENGKMKISLNKNRKDKSG